MEMNKDESSESLEEVKNAFIKEETRRMQAELDRDSTLARIESSLNQLLKEVKEEGQAE